MGQVIRIISQLYDTDKEEVINEIVLHREKLKSPKTLQQLGYKHKDQIKILQQAQDFKLSLQEKLINTDDICPNCGKQNRKQGKFTSAFHAIFTDHQLEIQRRTCSCGWRSAYTIDGLFGSSMHPDLIERQCLLGADHSFQKAELILTQESCQHRSINNDDRIKRTIGLVGKKLELVKKEVSWSESKILSPALIVTIDGGHLSSKIDGKRTFEALIATVYSPDAIKLIDKNHRQITKKTSVASAKEDNQKTMKQLVMNACKQQGMNKETVVTALTDGAKNCWNIVDALSGECRSLISVLDWFHIGKKFKMVSHLIPDMHLALFDKVKWHLWHGHPDTALIRLKQLQSLLSEKEEAINKLESIKKYIEKNKLHIVNYHARRIKGEVYTSNVAETSVNTIINSRQKKNQKMQWTREGAHAILQIRTSLFSRNWKKDWERVQQHIYKQAA